MGNDILKIHSKCDEDTKRSLIGNSEYVHYGKEFVIICGITVM